MNLTWVEQKGKCKDETKSEPIAYRISVSPADVARLEQELGQVVPVIPAEG